MQSVNSGVKLWIGFTSDHQRQRGPGDHKSVDRTGESGSRREPCRRPENNKFETHRTYTHARTHVRAQSRERNRGGVHRESTTIESG